VIEILDGRYFAGFWNVVFPETDRKDWLMALYRDAWSSFTKPRDFAECEVIGYVDRAAEHAAGRRGTVHRVLPASDRADEVADALRMLPGMHSRFEGNAPGGDA